MKIWKVLETKEIFKTGIFRFKADRCEISAGKIMPNYYVFEFPDWVNIVPVTPEGKIVLIKQYRHATQEITIEIPGGSMHSHDSEITIDHIRKDARRELVEETGYDSQEWQYVGFHHPNPALQNNKMHTFVALNCKKVAEQNLDPYEDIEFFEVTQEELKKMIRKNEITHSIVLTSIYRALDFLKTTST